MVLFVHAISKLVVNHNSNISHAPGGFIVNWNYNETHTLTRSDAPESMEVIEKCILPTANSVATSTDTT